jgi:hypothetical protein
MLSVTLKALLRLYVPDAALPGAGGDLGRVLLSSTSNMTLNFAASEYSNPPVSAKPVFKQAVRFFHS